MRRWLLVAAAVAVVTACSGNDDEGPAQLSLDVRPRTSSFDEPLSVAVHGVPAGARAEVEVSSTDASGVAWAGRATFVADSSGDIDVAEAEAVDGTYSGVQPLGLVESMEPSSRGALYRWGTGARPLRFSASTPGERVVTATVDRRFTAPEVQARTTDLAVDGFVGQLWSPPGGSRVPAAVLLGGSDGGIGPVQLAAALASHGVPALAVGYFGLPGLPPRLESIPLEYFDTAVEWLRRQPGVDPDRITVVGVSRGGEAAILVADHFSGAVHAAVGLVGGNVVVCSPPDCGGPPWTLGGQPLPYTRQFNEPRPTDVPDAFLPVDGIKGPVLLACGGRDVVWVSCNYADALADRLDDAHPEAPHDVLRYRRAGHSVGFVLPGVPGLTSFDQEGGGDLTANRLARADLWPRLLDFLGAHR